jgi:flagellar hook protein FlgE
MSLFGAMTTAISGLNAQSRALGHISDNVANSQTVGFKRIDTNFVSLITASSLVSHRPGAVLARPDYTNTVQGTIEQAESPLSLAIAGQGFFSVALSNGRNANQVTFDERQFYTRSGDFAMDRDGYLVNGAGYYLQGWQVDDATNELNRTSLSPIRVSQLVYNPQETTRVDLSANLPGGAEDGTTASSQIQFYDALGGQHTLTMDWTSTSGTTPNSWELSLVVDGDTATALGPYAVVFNTDGTMQSLNGVSDPDPSDDTDVAAELAVTIPSPPLTTAQPLTIGLGTLNRATGVTQFSDDEYSVRSASQDGVPLGSFSSVSILENGDVSINYDNGQFRIIARVPVVTFNDADKLQRLDGQAFMRTVESGEARISDPNQDGAGKLSIGAIERSNVDIASEFSKLILAQRAYTSNTRIVTAADEMLQDTINMKR